MTNALTSLYSAAAVLAQATGQAATASEATKVQSVWDFVVKGGPVMIPIGICSLVALTVIVERMISLRRRNIVPRGFLPGLLPLMSQGTADRSAALEYCGRDDSPIARVLSLAIKKLGEPTEVLERRIQEAGEREVALLRKHMRLLSVIASVAPLLGLLGTITGMITAFQTVATSAEALGRTELLAKGIYEAMITTAAGLMVTIPTLIAYHWISSRVDALVHEMDGLVMEFVEGQAPPRPVIMTSATSARLQAVVAPVEEGDGRPQTVALAS